MTNKTNWKRWLKNNPLTAPLLNQFHERKHKTYQGKPSQQVFTEIYQSNKWQSEESFSGSGSELIHSQAIREAFPELWEKYDIKKILDIPCGDFNWQQHLDWTGLEYFGGDIVEEIIQANQQKYTQSNIHFEAFNLLEDTLPKADVVLIRDTWVHFSLEDIFKSIHHLQKSSIKYLLSTTFTAQNINLDITTGSWRPLNLEKTPFHFPKPLQLISEKSTQSNGQYPDKNLGLWRISDLQLPVSAQAT